MRFRLLLAAALTVGATLSAQQPGTGSISGIVTTDGPQPAPVRRAVVTLSGDVARPLGALTDQDGRFTFSRLPPGRFTVTAAKAAFITTAYGARRPGRPGTQVTVAAGQQVTGIAITLTRGAVITGTIRDQNGEPMKDVIVNAVPIDRVRTSMFQNLVISSGNFITDDRGVYRIFGLTPGEYAVAANVRLTGGVGQIGIMSSSDIDAALRDLQNGRGRGGAAPPPTVPLRHDPMFNIAPVFYPGTSKRADAGRVTVGAGEERAGVDVQVRFARTATVAGTVTSPDGVIPPVIVTIREEGAPESAVFDAFGAPTSERPGPDGKFRLTGVMPGTYRIQARPAPPANAGPRAAGPAASPPPPTSPALWAAADVTVDGQNIEGVSLALQPTMKFSGRIAFAGAAPPPADVTLVRVGLAAAGALMPMLATGEPVGPPASTTVQVRVDGTFDVTGLVPGDYRLIVTAPPSAWWLRSAVVGGADALDTFVHVEPGSDAAGAVLTFSDRHSELSGLLQTSTGAPAPEYFVVVVPADRTLWRSAMRRMKSTRPATDGRFVFRDLPAGDYLLGALSDFEPSDLEDQAFFEQLARGAITVTVADGEARSQDIRIAR